MKGVNPYTPGAGRIPLYIAGREDEIEEATLSFEALNLNISARSIIYSGLRGVGKTVLINKLKEIAEDNQIYCQYIEIERKKDFISQIATVCRNYLREVSRYEKVKEYIQQGLDAIKSLVVSFDPNGSVSLSVQERELFLSNSLTQSLSDVFISVGKMAYKTHKPICVFIDEIQYIDKDELSSLISALHRINQLNYPVMVIAAGLPKIYKMLSTEKSYSEGLFSYRKIDILDDENATLAIRIPCEKMGVDITDEAIYHIKKITKGYPFYIQNFCKIIYDYITEKEIKEADVIQNIDEYYKDLDNGFFKTRYERCSDKEKEFLFAMIYTGNIPCEISSVSKVLDKAVNSISPIRGKLIEKGIIYSGKHGYLDFTVPDFDEFISRNNDYKIWCDRR